MSNRSQDLVFVIHKLNSGKHAWVGQVNNTRWRDAEDDLDYGGQGADKGGEWSRRFHCINLLACAGI